MASATLEIREESVQKIDELLDGVGCECLVAQSLVALPIKSSNTDCVCIHWPLCDTHGVNCFPGSYGIVSEPMMMSLWY